LKFAAHFDALLLAFSTYISLIGEEKLLFHGETMPTAAFSLDAIGRLQAAHSPFAKAGGSCTDPYRFETIVDGCRTTAACSLRRVPHHAPPSCRVG
jgi:hypothetical protein